jgi:hypothetical protein
LTRSEAARTGSSWGGFPLQFVKPADRLFGAVSTHFVRGLQARADGWPLRFAKDAAPIVLVKLSAADTRGFSSEHARYRAGNGRRNATRAAAGAATVLGVGGHETRTGIIHGAVHLYAFARFARR